MDIAIITELAGKWWDPADLENMLIVFSRPFHLGRSSLLCCGAESVSAHRIRLDAPSTYYPTDQLLDPYNPDLLTTDCPQKRLTHFG
jgi:hypothetical protein